MNDRTSTATFHQASSSKSRLTSHPPIPTASLSRTSSPSSQSGGRINRGDITRRTSTSSLRYHPEPMDAPIPSTPSPRKSARRKRLAPAAAAAAAGRSDQRHHQSGQNVETGPHFSVDSIEQASSDDDQALFDLLGVTSPPVDEGRQQPKGLLTLTKEGMDDALNGNSRRNRGRNKAETSSHQIKQSSSNPGSPTPKVRGGRPPKQSRSGVDVNGVPETTKDNSLTNGMAHQDSNADKSIPNRESIISKGDVVKPRGAKKDVSGIPAGKKQRLPKGSNPPVEVKSQPQAEPFDVTSLSQSLPSNGFLGPPKLGMPTKSNPIDASDDHHLKYNVKAQQRNSPLDGNKDESSIWDMPIEAGSSSGTQELTWQQKLQGSSTSTQNDGSGVGGQNTPTKRRQTSDRKLKTRSTLLSSSTMTTTTTPPIPSPLNPKLTSSISSPQTTTRSSTRRMSLDPNHHSRPSKVIMNLDTAGGTGIVGNQRPFSNFDSSIPYHVGMNVNRPPQTPSKSFNNNNKSADLPILPGEFPRIGRVGNGPGNAHSPSMGPKYAGPTFHNSPHAGSLPKPDLDDF